MSRIRLEELEERRRNISPKSVSNPFVVDCLARLRKREPLFLFSHSLAFSPLFQSPSSSSSSSSFSQKQHSPFFSRWKQSLSFFLSSPFLPLSSLSSPSSSFLSLSSPSSPSSPSLSSSSPSPSPSLSSPSSSPSLSSPSPPPPSPLFPEQQTSKIRQWKTNIQLLKESTFRLIRDTWCVTWCVLDYLSLMRNSFVTREEEERAWHLVHARCAERVLRLCFKNGGVYIKFGQHVASLQYLLPMEYVETMKPTLDRTPTSTKEQVRQVFREEYGEEPEHFFDQFDYKPFASASLAQVHVAYLKSGQKVAVKVQHPHLAKTARADAETVSFFAKVLNKIFPDFDYLWLANEIKLNLPKELNFMNEGENAERCHDTMFDCDAAVVVPHIFWDVTTSRILTMEFMEGCKVNDLKAIQKMGLNPKEVAEAVCEAFNHQIFLKGDVHCDPHPGNIFVRRRDPSLDKKRWDGRKKKGVVELVLLDHGLYSSLSDQFRIRYCALWKAVVSSDIEGIRKTSALLNAESLFPLLASVLTASPWEQISSGAFSTDIKPHQFEEIRGRARKHVKEIGKLLATLPREMLLLLKTNDCLRAIDFQLGCPTNSDIIRMRYCLRGLIEHERKINPGFRTWFKTEWEWCQMQFRIVTFRMMVWLSHVIHPWLSHQSAL